MEKPFQRRSGGTVFSRQFELLELTAFLIQRGKTAVIALHDLSHALRYSSQTVLMGKGRTVLRAPPEELYESGELERVFGVRSHRAGADYYFMPGGLER